MNRKEYAFSKYYNEYFEIIKKYCCYKLNDHLDIADDCVQETFEVLYKTICTGETIDYPKAYLFKVAEHIVSNKFRELKKQKSTTVSLDESTENIVYDEKFFDEIDESEIIKIKDEIFDSLSKDEKELLSYTIKDYKTSYKTTKELSDLYQVSETTIRQRIFVLRKKIKKIVKEKIKDL